MASEEETPGLELEYQTAQRRCDKNQAMRNGKKEERILTLSLKLFDIFNNNQSSIWILFLSKDNILYFPAQSRHVFCFVFLLFCFFFCVYSKRYIYNFNLFI